MQCNPPELALNRNKKTLGSESVSGQDKLAGAGHNGTSLKMMSPSLKKKKQTKNIVVKAIK